VAADPGYAPERSIASAYLRPLTLADVLDGMFELFTANWRVYVVALGALLIPMNFAVSYLTSEVYGGAGLLDQLSNPAAAEAFFAGGPSLTPFIGLIAVSVVSFVLVTPFVNGVACRIAADGYEHRQPTTGEVLRATLRRYAALVGVTLLLALIVLAVMALPSLLVFGAVTTESPQLGVAAAALFVVGGGVIVFVLVRLSLAYAVVVVERVGPVTALQRSFRLVRGRYWRTLFTLVLAGIIAGFVAQIVSLPFSVPGSLFGDWAGVVFSAVGGVVVAVLTTPLAANAQTLLYFDGRVRVEGYDLDVLSRELTAAAGPPLG
jgi:hypothetical protein